MREDNHNDSLQAYKPGVISSYTVIRKTWLSKKLDPLGVIYASLATLLLVLGSFDYLKNFSGAESWMPASRFSVFVEHNVWRAWTTLFAHADIKHLLSNSFLFFILGTFISGHFGRWVFPATAFLMGGLTNLIVLQNMKPSTQLIGASGIVFWMGGFWLTLYVLLDTRRTRVQRAFRSIGVGLLLFMPSETFNPSVSYQAHFVGFILGIIFGLGYFQKNKREFKSAEISETIHEYDYIGMAPR